MFKRSQLFVAVATAAAACFGSAASATELKAAAYADLRYSIDDFNDTNSANPASVTMDNHGSYWGVKGSAEQGGVTAFGGYERWLDVNNNLGIDLTRQGYAGVTGAWGTVEYGTFATAYMDSGRKLDPFYDTGAAGVGSPHVTTAGGLLPLLGGQSHGLSNLTADRPTSGLIALGLPSQGGFVPNQLAYTTPTLWGLRVNAGVMFDPTPGPNAQNDYEAGLEFSNWGLTAGVQYLAARSDTTSGGTPGIGNTGLPEDTEAARLYGAFNQKRFGVGVSAERLDLNAGANNQDYVMASGWFGVLEGTRVAASFGMEHNTAAEGQSARVGVFYDVLDNFTTYVAYRKFNSTDFGRTGAPDDQVVTLGATYKFELSGSTTK